MNRDQIASCTVCPWMGTDIAEYEGFEVCPECLSAVVWADDVEPDEEAELTALDAMDMPPLDTPESYLDHARAMTGYPRSFSRSYRASEIGPRAIEQGRTPDLWTQRRQPSLTPVADPRLKLLKDALSASLTMGHWLRGIGTPEAREAARPLLRACGRVCVARGEVKTDPAHRAGS